MLNKKYRTTILLLLLTNTLFSDLKCITNSLEYTLPIGTNLHNFEFKLENDGNSVVKILDIKTSCGCTIAKMDKSVYKPGERGTINGTITLPNSVGVKEEEIKILTDSIASSTLSLFLKIIIPKTINLKPGLILWKLNEPSFEKESRIKLFDSAILLSSMCNSENFQFKIKQEVNDASSYIITVKAINTSKIVHGEIILKIKTKDGNERNCYLHLLIR